MTIGDDVTLNAGSWIQCHSQEDYAFKSDRITIGSGCTLGVGALVHLRRDDRRRCGLAADSFLMKGEEVPPHAHVGRQPRPATDASIVDTVPRSSARPAQARRSRRHVGRLTRQAPP